MARKKKKEDKDYPLIVFQDVVKDLKSSGIPLLDAYREMNKHDMGVVRKVEIEFKRTDTYFRRDKYKTVKEILERRAAKQMTEAA